MKTAYITEQGATLRRDGPVLGVWTGRTRRAELLVHDLDQLVLMGNIMVTPAVLDFLIGQRVDTVFMSIHGRFRGRLMHEHSKNVRLRLAQYARLQDPGVALALAKTIVRAKILNTRTFLLRAARRQSAANCGLRNADCGMRADGAHNPQSPIRNPQSNDPQLAQAAARLLAMAERAAEMTTLDQVRGCEGRASAVYFEVFGRLIKNPDFTFSDRNRRPPLDPVNVLLSLGYTLLANAVETAVQIVGLDPYLGGLHDIAYGRPSLVCDLMEEYRPILVDPMVVACLNQKSFSLDDFEGTADCQHPGAPNPQSAIPNPQSNDPQSEGPVRFKRTAMRWFVELFERRIRAEIAYPPRGQRLSYRQVIEEQVRQFARFLLGTEPAYEPFRIR